ncbi:MAG: relaxase/mobilization nuclease domain-containing protein [Pseudomonadota bacterium]
MILKASQRSGAAQLSSHLLNGVENDHVEVIEVRGFMADDLGGALLEAYAISKATRCRQYLFSLSLNPPKDYVASEKEFLSAIDRAEETLGLTDQPRVVVVHEKEGRRHAHVVWSRIDGEAMKAIPMSHFKRKLNALSRDLYFDHGWELPNGLKTHGGRNPLNFTLAEWQQAKRQKIDPREIKQAIKGAWERSDSLKGLQSALEDQGYFLACGDRRGFVVLDTQGEVYALSRWAGIKAKEVKAKLGSPDQLASIDEAKAMIRSKVTDQMRGYIAQVKDRHEEQLAPLRDEHRSMKEAHATERRKLREGQEKRWVKETKARSARLNTGMRGLFDRLTGKAKATQAENLLEARQCAARDQAQRTFMIEAQMRERQTLQFRFHALRQKQREERRLLAQQIVHRPSRDEPKWVQPHTRQPKVDLSI